MRGKLILLALMAGLGTNIHAASRPIPLDVIEMLGEMENSDAVLDQAIKEAEQTRKVTQQQTTSDAPKTQQTGGKRQ
jgi:hypothetical protein